MAASASISVDPAAIQIQSGGHASARVGVLNRGDTVGQYVLDVQGLESTWFKLEPEQLGIFPGDKAAVKLQIHPPANSISATFRVIIRAVNLVDPSDLAQAVLTLTLQKTEQSANETIVSAKLISPKVSDLPNPPTLSRAQKPAASPPVAEQSFVIEQAAIKDSSPSGQVLLTANRDGVKVMPGSSQSLILGLSNNGGVSLGLEMQVKGVPASWLSLTTGESLTVAPGGTNFATLSVSVPVQAPLGNYPLNIIVQGVEDALLRLHLNMMIEVIKPGDIMIELDPPQMEGEVSAQFSVLLSQAGSTPVTVNLSGRDDGGRLDYLFFPASVIIPSGGKKSSRLMVRSKQKLTDEDSRTIPFEVTASGVDGVAGSFHIEGRLIQHRGLSGRLILQPNELRDPIQAVYTLRLLNPDQSVMTYHLSASDSDGGCSYQFKTPSLNVPPGSEASTLLYVTPHQYLDGGEIIHTFTVTAETSGSFSSVIKAEGRYNQIAIQMPGLALSPPSQTSSGPAAVFSVVVTNPRSTQLQIELRPYDTGNLCRFVIDAPRLSVAPLSQVTTRLNVYPNSKLLPGEARRVCAFTLAGYPAEMPTPVVVEGSLLLVNGFTWRNLLPFLIAAVIFLGIGGMAVIALIYLNFIR